MKLPTTLNETVDYLIPQFEGLDDLFTKKSEDAFSLFCHSQLSGGIGMQIRNNLGFWTKDTDIYNHMVEVHNLEHPDEMSDLILREVYKKWNKL